MTFEFPRVENTIVNYMRLRRVCLDTCFDLPLVTFQVEKDFTTKLILLCPGCFLATS